jgi:hypothetical protein
MAARSIFSKNHHGSGRFSKKTYRGSIFFQQIEKLNKFGRISMFTNERA